MSGAETGVGASLVKVGVAVIQRAAPTGIALLKSWLKGKDVLIVGQARAGKTTFVDYLQHGLFEDEKEKEKTKREEKTARFNVKMGRDSSLELSVKSVRDVPGQWGPVAHADLAAYHRPHALLIFIDLANPLRGKSERASAAWLLEFCRHLESRWRIKGRRGNRIKSIILVMNKLDKSDAKKMASRKKEFRKILDAELREARGLMMDEIAILPCIVVTNSEGTKAVDGVITHLAKALAK